MSAYSPPRLPHAAPSAYPALYAAAREPLAALIVGDSAIGGAMALEAVLYLARAERLALLAFWGRAAPFHAERGRETRAALRVLGFGRFEPIDLAEDADAVADALGVVEGQALALLDPTHPLEGRVLRALAGVTSLEPWPAR